MIQKTAFSISEDLLAAAVSNIPSENGKFTLNEPTNRFFYDPWELKKEFVGTPWERIYHSLPFLKGEARIICLESGSNYLSHADIDDRYHLNLTGENCYLIDLDDDMIHKIQNDKCWYLMDAGKIHSAVNLGRVKRYQLVVRRLLTESTIVDPLKICIESKIQNPRFIFDNSISPWLNKTVKAGMLNDFDYVDDTVRFVLSKEKFNELVDLAEDRFEIKVL